MAAQVSTKKRGAAPVSATMMREDNQRISSRLSGGVAYRHLAAWCVAQRNREDVLSFWGNILARMLSRRRIPDLTREPAVTRRIQCLYRTHTNRKPPPDEWVVLARPRPRLVFSMCSHIFNALASH